MENADHGTGVIGRDMAECDVHPVCTVGDAHNLIRILWQLNIVSFIVRVVFQSQVTADWVQYLVLTFLETHTLN